MSEDTRSIWMYVGLGCGGCALLVGVLVIVSVIGGIRLARTMEEEMTDPVARTEKAKQLLGAEELPEGYHAVLSISLPLMFETVVLADRPAEPEDGLAEDTEKVFVYVEVIRGGSSWKDYTEGRADAIDVLKEQNIHMDRRAEEVGRGQLALAGATVDYVSQRGMLNIQNDSEFEGLATFLLILCEGSKKMRMGVWSNADPNLDVPIEEVDYTGTSADPEQIARFLESFDFCGA